GIAAAGAHRPEDRERDRLEEAMNAVPQAVVASNLACSELTVAVADRALVRDLQLTIASGAVTAVLGRNGAGKTMTLHTLAGLRTPSRGTVTLDGQPLASWP